MYRTRALDLEERFSLSYRNWFSRLISKWHLTPLKTFGLVLVYNMVTNMGGAWYFHAWHKTVHNGQVISGLLQEPGAWAIFLIAQPVIFSIGVWVLKAPDAMIGEIINSGALLYSSKVKEALRWGHNKIRNKYLYGTAWGVAVIVQTFIILLEKGIIGNYNPTWLNISPIVFWSRTVVAIIVYYVLSVSVFSGAITVLTLNRIMSCEGVIKVIMYHPDHAGGLGAIGRFVSNVGYLAFAFAVTIVIFFWQAKIASKQASNTGWFIVSIISTIVHFSISLLVFYLPIRTTHNAMRAYKTRVLTSLSTVLNRNFKKALLDVSREKRPAFISDLAKVQHVYRLYNHAENLPEWPFNISMIRKYFSLSMSPVLSFALSILYEWIVMKIQSGPTTFP